MTRELGISLALVVLMPALAEACSCIPSGPPCQEVWETPVLFSGTVVAVDQAPGTFGPQRVRFRIAESFRGVTNQEIDIELRGGGGASCDPPFRLGESWLVYASRQQGGAAGWTTSTCSRTRRMSMAAEDLRYLRLPDAQKPPSHIAGRVTQGSERGEGAPVPGVPVVVTGGGTRLDVRTDADGRYLIPLDPFRAYRVAFGRVAGLVVREPAVDVLLRHYRACVIVNAFAR